MLSNNDIQELRHITNKLAAYISFLANKRVSISGQEAIVDAQNLVVELDKIVQKGENYVYEG